MTQARNRINRYLAGGTILLVVYTSNMGLRMSNALELSDDLSRVRRAIPTAQGEYDHAKARYDGITVRGDEDAIAEDTQQFYLGVMNNAQNKIVDSMTKESELENRIKTEKRKAFFVI